MPKGYVIARAVVTNATKWAEYAAEASKVIKQYGGVPLVRGGAMTVAEGEGRARNVVIEFESLEAAKAYAFSAEYAAARKLREGPAISTSFAWRARDGERLLDRPARYHDPEKYAEYRKLNGIAFAKYGGRFLVRGGAYQLVKGTSRQHNVVIEFPSGDAARACVQSPEYQAALAVLSTAGTSDLVVIDGYEGPQPGDPV